MSFIRESLRHISDLVSNELDESHVHSLIDEPGYGVTFSYIKYRETNVKKKKTKLVGFLK